MKYFLLFTFLLKLYFVIVPELHEDFLVIVPTGGSQGGCLRFEPANSSDLDSNLSTARSFLEPIKKSYPSISYSDLWVLAGYVAIEQMGGIKMDFLAGRKDAEDNTSWYFTYHE